MRVVIIWGIWNQRNKSIFRQGKIDCEEIWCITQLSTWTWMKNKKPGVMFSYLEWCLSLVRRLKTLSYKL